MGTFTYLFAYDASDDLVEKSNPGGDVLPGTSTADDQAFVTSLVTAAGNFITAQIANYPGVPIYGGTLSDPMPVTNFTNLWSLLNQSPVALYNRFIGSNANLGRRSINPDNISYFVITVTYLDSTSPGALVGVPEYYIFFLNL